MEISTFNFFYLLFFFLFLFLFSFLFFLSLSFLFLFFFLSSLLLLLFLFLLRGNTGHLLRVARGTEHPYRLSCNFCTLPCSMYQPLSRFIFNTFRSFHSSVSESMTYVRKRSIRLVSSLPDWLWRSMCPRCWSLY